MNYPVDYCKQVVKELAMTKEELGYVAFEVNNKDLERIAKYISGLSNAATLMNMPYAYIIWGVEDGTYKIVGTEFDYRKEKKGNMELELWLNQQIFPKINFKFHQLPFETEDGNTAQVVLLEIPCAEDVPTRYGGVGYIRIGSNLKPLAEYKEKEAELWKKLDTTPFDLRIAYQEASADDVTAILDYPGYYRKLGMPIPSNREKVLDDLMDEKFIVRNDGGTWDITNYGVLMIGQDLKKFDHLAKRGVRVIRYVDKSRLEGISEETFSAGYAIAYEQIASYILAVIPQKETMDIYTRKHEFAFPESAIRELLANMMIHQDFEQKGTSPMVEIFSDRIEFSNAGAPLVRIERIVDCVPVSRNERIAGFMHRCCHCEERGSGYDKIISATSASSLMAPKIENQFNQFTKVTLYSKIPFDMLTKEDRVRTCYMQACLLNVMGDCLTNAKVRSVFGLSEAEKTKASRIIRDTLAAKMIKPIDPDTAPRYMRYQPFWA